MTSQHLPFVGRQRELALFDQALRDPRGQVILVVGQQGLGKTALLDKMVSVLESHPDLQCGSVRYTATEKQDPASLMATIIDDAFEAAELTDRSVDKTPRRRKQFDALIKLLPKGKELLELAHSLRRDPQKDTRKQFRDRLELISERMPENGRALFFLDPEKYMQDGSSDDWRLVLNDLPDKIKFVFAQRPDDVLITNHDFMGEIKPLRIPDHALEVLDEQAVDDLIQARAADVRVPIAELRRELHRYQGHPYAIQGAIDLVASGLPLDRLPTDPTDTHVAAAQWERLRELGGPNAVRLFEAYAILDVAVPDAVVEPVAELSPADRKALLANRFLASLLRDEAGSRRIYHSLLADHIGEQLSEETAKPYHQRAVRTFRTRLQTDGPPDKLASLRLFQHVLAAEGRESAVLAFINESGLKLTAIGHLDAVESLSHRALAVASSGGAEEAAIIGNLGLVYRTRGDLDRAEELHRKALAIEEKLGREAGMAHQYGNLGLIYETRGDLERAEEMHGRALAIDEKLGLQEGMAIRCGNLGGLYQTRGDLDRAEQMLRKALAIDERLGRLEGLASNYGNLGMIHQTRGDLDRAEEMLRKALAIFEKLGRLEGIANQYGNLGLIYETRGDLERAEEMHRKALAIDEELGRLEGAAIRYGNLGVIYETRGDLDRAEEMQRKALAIDQELGRLEGMAIRHANLGTIAEQRGDADAARELWAKSRDLYAKIGMPHMVQKVQSWLDTLPPT